MWASPTSLTVIDCFPPNTNKVEIDETSMRVVAHFLKTTNEGKSCEALPFEGQSVDNEGSSYKRNNDGRNNDMANLIPPAKKPKVAMNPNRGRPLHLSNLKKRNSKLSAEDRGGKTQVRGNLADAVEDNKLCEVVISPSKKMEDAVAMGLLGKWGKCGKTTDRWRLAMLSPAESHKFVNMELPRAWEPSESSGTAERSQVGFLM